MSRRHSSIPICAVLIAVILSGPADAFARKKQKDKDKAEEVQSQSAPSEAMAAMIGDVPVTVDEVDGVAGGRLMKARQQEYEVRRNVLDSLISDRLLDLEAAERGVSRQDLLQQEVSSKIPDPSDVEVNAYYLKNRKRYGEKTLEQVESQIISILRSQKLGTTEL